MSLDEDGKYIPFTKKDETHPSWGEEEKDLSHRQFVCTPQATQIRSAFRKGLWLGEHDNATEDDLLAIFRSLVDVMDKVHPLSVGKMYDKLRPKAERYYRERNRQLKRK